MRWPRRSNASSGTIRMSGSTSGASGLGSLMPHPPARSRSPNAQLRMISGSPRPATTGSASLAPDSASLRISGSALISLFNGMKPETIAPGGTATGNGRAAIACAAAARTSAGSASRRASASRRSVAFSLLAEAMHCRHVPGIHVFHAPRKTWMAGTSPAMTEIIDAALENERQLKTKSAEPRWPLEHRSRVPYESRWAPYVRAHEPGQGQLP